MGNVEANGGCPFRLRQSAAKTLKQKAGGRNLLHPGLMLLSGSPPAGQATKRSCLLCVCACGACSREGDGLFPIACRSFGSTGSRSGRSPVLVFVPVSAHRCGAGGSVRPPYEKERLLRTLTRAVRGRRPESGPFFGGHGDRLLAGCLWIIVYGSLKVGFVMAHAYAGGICGQRESRCHLSDGGILMLVEQLSLVALLLHAWMPDVIPDNGGSWDPYRQGWDDNCSQGHSFCCISAYSWRCSAR